MNRDALRQGMASAGALAKPLDLIQPGLGSALGTTLQVGAMLVPNYTNYTPINPYNSNPYGKVGFLNGGAIDSAVLSSYLQGGAIDQNLSTDSFKVKGNPGVDKNFRVVNGTPVLLSKDEVVASTSQGDYVFSDNIRNPLTGNTIAKDAENIKKRQKQAEERAALGDPISKLTVSQLKDQSDMLTQINDAALSMMDKLGINSQEYKCGGKIKRRQNGGALERYNDGGKIAVKKGDTLWALGKKYGVAWEEIAKANGISDPKKLQVGTELVLPGQDNVVQGGTLPEVLVTAKRDSKYRSAQTVPDQGRRYNTEPTAASPVPQLNYRAELTTPDQGRRYTADKLASMPQQTAPEPDRVAKQMAEIPKGLNAYSQTYTIRPTIVGNNTYRSGNVTPAQAQKFREANPEVNTIVYLKGANENKKGDKGIDVKKLKAMGYNVEYLPIGTLKGEGEKKNFQKAVDLVKQGNVWVMCEHGYDRTGAVCAQAGLDAGFSNDQVIEHNFWKIGDQTYPNIKGKGSAYQPYADVLKRADGGIIPPEFEAKMTFNAGDVAAGIYNWRDLGNISHDVLTNDMIDNYGNYVVMAAEQYGLNPLDLAAQIAQESGWNFAAKSPTGPLGLAQINGQMARAYGLQTGGPNDDRYNPEKSILAMAQIMRDNLDKNVREGFGDDLALARMRYSEGGPRMKQMLRTGELTDQAATYHNKINKRKEQMYQGEFLDRLYNWGTLPETPLAGTRHDITKTFKNGGSIKGYDNGGPIEDVQGFQAWVTGKYGNNVLAKYGVDGKWGNETQAAWDKYGKEWLDATRGTITPAQKIPGGIYAKAKIGDMQAAAEEKIKTDAGNFLKNMFAKPEADGQFSWSQVKPYVGDVLQGLAFAGSLGNLGDVEWETYPQMANRQIDPALAQRQIRASRNAALQQAGSSYSTNQAAKQAAIAQASQLETDALLNIAQTNKQLSAQTQQYNNQAAVQNQIARLQALGARDAGMQSSWHTLRNLGAEMTNQYENEYGLAALANSYPLVYEGLFNDMEAFLRQRNKVTAKTN